MTRFSIQSILRSALQELDCQLQTTRYTRWQFPPPIVSRILRMKLGRAAIFVGLCCVLTSAPVSAQTQRALLIGINTYEPPGTTPTHPPGCVYGRCELGYFENLDGAVNDAQSMADVLTSPRFGFPVNQVVLLTNPAP